MDNRVAIVYECTVRTTARGVLIRFADGHETWLPKSQIAFGYSQYGKIVSMPDWLAERVRNEPGALRCRIEKLERKVSKLEFDRLNIPYKDDLKRQKELRDALKRAVDCIKCSRDRFTIAGLSTYEINGLLPGLEKVLAS